MISKMLSRKPEKFWLGINYKGIKLLSENRHNILMKYNYNEFSFKAHSKDFYLIIEANERRFFTD